MRSISLINTQSQLLNCIDCINQLGLIDNVLIVVNSTRAVHERILSTIDDETRKHFSIIKLFYKSPKNRIDNVIFRIKIINYIKNVIHKNKFDVGITSLYSQVNQRHLFYELEKKGEARLILVDDGISTIDYNRIRKLEIEEKKSAIYNKKNIETLFCGGKRFRSYYPCAVTFFTLYDFSPVSQDFIVKNERLFTEGYISEKLKDSETINYQVVVVGQPLVPLLFPQEVYNVYMKKIYQYFVGKGEKIIYYLHPAEPDNSVSAISSDDFKVVRNSLPLEYIAMSLPDNTKIVSFTSSVLPNLVSMGKKLDYYSVFLDECEVLKSRVAKEFLMDYKYFEKIGINILHL